jgi:hypothetical protein
MSIMYYMCVHNFAKVTSLMGSLLATFCTLSTLLTSRLKLGGGLQVCSNLCDPKVIYISTSLNVLKVYNGNTFCNMEKSFTCDDVCQYMIIFSKFNILNM